jgi:DNA-binding NtrC family response regulator
MAGNKINLLFVDDEVDFLNSMAKRLEVRGYNVIAVDRGEKAIEAAKDQPIDIVLLDLKMPGLGGEETLKLLKEENDWMEVVILTGHGSLDSAAEMTESGAYKYLQKPCELDQLLEVLKDAYKHMIMKKSQIKEE